MGPGLLGGSIAAALPAKTTLWARDPAKVDEAKTLGFSATTDLNLAVEDAELVILATPVGVMESLATRLAPLLSPTTLVTDVGSVKCLPHDKAGRLLEDAGIHFIGSHPMAGSEKTGIQNASPTLFKGAACILTNPKNVGEKAVDRLQTFWESLGCHTSMMGPQEHDALVARLSHFPHAMASLTSLVSLTNPEQARFAGGGLRDTTRVAGGDPKMWAEILIENRTPLLKTLEESHHQLANLLQLLETSDQDGLERFLNEAKHRRDSAPIIP